MPIEKPIEKWSGSVRSITIGATSTNGGSRKSTVTVGGQKSMPFLHYENEFPNPSVFAIEIKDFYPADWSSILHETWGESMKNVGAWAKAAEDAGADILQLSLSLVDDKGNPNTPDKAVAAVKAVLDNSGLPLIVYGPGQSDKDNELLIAVSDAAKGERLVLGACEEKNYRTIVASSLANGHLVTSRAPMDVNLSKQLNILISDMGMPAERIIMDPTAAALGYGVEYGFSAMERLRLAALQGDSMTQFPMIVNVGFETWKTKESKVGDDVPQAWGEWKERSINWETMTAMTFLEAGADILVCRHPESLRRLKTVLADLSKKPELA